MFRKITGLTLTAALLLLGTGPAQAAYPTVTFANYYDHWMTNPVPEGSVIHLGGTGLSRITAAYFEITGSQNVRLSAPISEQTYTSLTLRVPKIDDPNVTHADIKLSIAEGDFYFDMIRFVGPKKLPVNIAFRSAANFPTLARPSTPATDLTTATWVTLGQAMSGSLPVQYSTNNPKVCAIIGGKLTYRAAGTCVLTAQQPESNAGLASNVVSKNITVVPAGKAQKIVVYPPNSMLTVVRSEFGLNASSTSGLPVTLTSNSPSFCTINKGKIATWSTPAKCHILVTQPGDAVWEPAKDVEIIFNLTTVGVPGPKSEPVVPFIVPTLKAKSSTLISLNSLQGTKTSGANVDGLATKISVASASKSICAITPVKDLNKNIVGYSIKGTKVGKCTVSVAVTGNSIYKSVTKTIALAIVK